jgi:hypothetical protein
MGLTNDGGESPRKGDSPPSFNQERKAKDGVRLLLHKLGAKAPRLWSLCSLSY